MTPVKLKKQVLCAAWQSFSKVVTSYLSPHLQLFRLHPRSQVITLPCIPWENRSIQSIETFLLLKSLHLYPQTYLSITLNDCAWSRRKWKFDDCKIKSILIISPSNFSYKILHTHINMHNMGCRHYRPKWDAHAQMDAGTAGRTLAC